MQKNSLENVCLRTNFDAVEKTKTFWGKYSNFQIFKYSNIQIFVSPSKNASHTISIYGNYMKSIFFFKKGLNQFLSPVCSTVLKNGLNFFSIVF